MSPQNKSVSELAHESGITEQTLYPWRRQLRNQGTPVRGSGKNAEEWTLKDKFAVVLETAALNAAELAEYCRRKGLYVEKSPCGKRPACRPIVDPESETMV